MSLSSIYIPDFYIGALKFENIISQIKLIIHLYQFNSLNEQTKCSCKVISSSLFERCIIVQEISLFLLNKKFC